METQKKNKLYFILFYMLGLILVAVISVMATLSWFVAENEEEYGLTMHQPLLVSLTTSRTYQDDSYITFTTDHIEPGMPIDVAIYLSLEANSPNAYARLSIDTAVYENEDQKTLGVEDETVEQSELDKITEQMTVIARKNGWFLHSDGYYYLAEDVNYEEASAPKVITTQGCDFVTTTPENRVEIPSSWGNEMAGKVIDFTISVEVVQSENLDINFVTDLIEIMNEEFA